MALKGRQRSVKKSLKGTVENCQNRFWVEMEGLVEKARGCSRVVDHMSVVEHL